MAFKIKIILVGGDEELASTIEEFSDPEIAGTAFTDLSADLESMGRE